MSERIRQTRAPARASGGRSDPSPRVPRPSAGAAAGFTLVELLVVMVIISILLGFILNAAMGSVKQANLRATQALITKLESGLNDRLDALMQNRPDPTQAHKLLGAVYYGNAIVPKLPPTSNQNVLPPWPTTQRSQVIAWFDYLKSEMPDVFFVQNLSPTASGVGVYPLNFAGNPYPVSGANPVGTGGALANQLAFVLPMGNSMLFPQGDGNAGNPAGTGIYGASYATAAGIYKNLGYLPQGYDGVDNDMNGTIDDAAEGLIGDPSVPAPENPQLQIPLHQLVQQRLGNHKHITARSEMLYALLVEGRGPLGSVFKPDDFTDKEVMDTDGDGLPEFVDAWGHPLQFFRWPLLYHSDIQRGQPIQAIGGTAWNFLAPYQNPAVPASSINLNMFQEREQDPLDVNQQLVVPSWWSAAVNNNTAGYFSGYSNPTIPGVSGAVQAFEFYFHRITEPFPNPGGAPFWDRGATFPGRRAFYSKFLIVSGGLDEQLGVFIYSDSWMQTFGQNAASPLIANENNALPFSPKDPTVTQPLADFTQSATYNYTSIQYFSSWQNPPPYPAPDSSQSIDSTNPSSYDLLQAAQDDISNQNMQSTVAIGGGG